MAVAVLAISAAVITFVTTLISGSPPPILHATPSPAQAPTDRPFPASFPAFAVAGPFDYADRAGQLVYSIGLGAEAGIYIAEADGSNPRRIAARTGTASLHEPRWAPDGRHLVYHSSGGAGTVHVTDDAGQLAFTLEGCCATWSPDGRLLATVVVHRRGGRPDTELGSATLRISNMRGVVVQQLEVPSTSFGNLLQLYWFPDGRAILLDDFVRHAEDGPRETWKLSIESGALVPYPVKPLYGAPTFFGRNGTRVVGLSEDGYVVAATAVAGGHLRLPTAEWFSSAWSPDGDRIAMLAGRGDDPELHIVDALTGAVSEAVEGMPQIGYVLDWSPNDGRILLSAGTGLWTLDSNGADPRLLVDGSDDGHRQPLLLEGP